MPDLLAKYRRKGLLIDANLLLAFLVGRCDPRLLESCRATTKYFGPEDFPLLVQFLGRFERLITTPHVLTEVSNLLGRLSATMHGRVRLVMRALIAEMSEEFMASKAASAEPDFLRFGLADTAISLLARGKYLVLTDDVSLAGLLAKRRVDVVNFNHIRMATGWWK